MSQLCNCKPALESRCSLTFSRNGVRRQGISCVLGRKYLSGKLAPFSLRFVYNYDHTLTVTFTYFIYFGMRKSLSRGGGSSQTVTNVNPVIKRLIVAGL